MDRAGDSNRITKEYFDSILIEMRHIDAEIPNTQLQLYGETFSTPVMTAALSHLDRLREDGMVKMAEAAAAANAIHWAGMGGEEELERMIATGAKTIKIVKPYADNRIIFDKLAHAERAGAFAVGMDIDHAFNARGEYDEVIGSPMRPKTQAELSEFVRFTKLPFIIKGVLSESDAEKCVEIGVGGIVVSHHHGIIDYAVPPLKILPRIAEIVGGRFPIFVDCGFESGSEVFKALALGATAVSVGRNLMVPLKESGADAVKEEILKITSGLKGIMARTGSASLSAIDRSCLHFLP